MFSLCFFFDFEFFISFSSLSLFFSLIKLLLSLIFSLNVLLFSFFFFLFDLSSFSPKLIEVLPNLVFFPSKSFFFKFSCNETIESGDNDLRVFFFLTSIVFEDCIVELNLLFILNLDISFSFNDFCILFFFLLFFLFFHYHYYFFFLYYYF